MAEIRKKTIQSTLIIYIGFAIGALNTLLFTRQNFFSAEEYGLTRVFVDIYNILFAFSMMGANAVVYKFYPFYKRNLRPEENDLLGNGLIWVSIGCLVIMLAGWLGHDIFIRKFSERSPALINYYFWLFPSMLFLALYTLIESYAWHLQKITITSFLRETLFRLLTTVLILLKLLGFITFHVFMISFSLSYAVLFFILLFYLVKVQKVPIVFKISRVTIRFRKQILTLASYAYSGNVIHNIAIFIGGILIANTSGLADAGIYTFANYFVSILQAPQRSILSISIPLLSTAWKDKDFSAIRTIYQRSSINMLIISLLLFFIMWLGMDAAIDLFHLNPSYHKGKPIFLILSIYWIIELGTGVNAQIIGTSNDWKFEFRSGLILLALSIPTNYFLVKNFGMIGAAYSGLISISIYNGVRYIFLIKKYDLQPFTKNTVKLVFISAIAYTLTYILTYKLTGLLYLSSSIICFSLLFLIPIYLFDITPDIKPVLQTVRKRLKI